MKYKSLFSCLLLIGTFVTCRLECHNHYHNDDHQELHWTKNKIELSNIYIQTAQPGMLCNTTQTTGRIMIHPDHLAFVIPKVEGVVKMIKKNQGDPVASDEILAVIESKEMAEAKSEYLALLKKLSLRKTLFEREEDLQNISAQQDYINARSAYEEALIDAELAKQRLYSFGLIDQEIDSIPYENPTFLRFYELRAPINGKIINRCLTLGELITSECKAFTIANFDKVWVELNVQPCDVRFLKEKQPIEIVCQDNAKISAMIQQFNPTICEQTRTATAFAILDNQSGNWTPGKFVSAIIQKEPIAAPIVIPKQAIQQMKGDDYVFVLSEEGFIPRIIRTGLSDEQHIEILSGLNIGELYASTNTFLLKADLEKEEAEHSD